MKNVILLFAAGLLGITGKGIAQSSSGRLPDEPAGMQNPEISEIVAEVNIDSLTATMQWMVGMGTRFMYAENRREVSSKIADKFRSYGYTSVMLDSFRVAGEVVSADSVWQYNVIAELSGASAPGEIYMVSAHHDDYCNPDPHVSPVPGADDNASGCAVTLEIARVMKVKGFRPEATIRFVTYAAEELVGYTHFSGSMYHAEKTKALGEDLRLHLCNDMVAWTGGVPLKICAVARGSGPNVWAGLLTVHSVALYSGLEIITVAGPVSDSEWFSKLGYPFAGFHDYGMSEYYHTRRDSVVNCRMELCRETTRANCAILLNEMLTPVPQQPYCVALKNGVMVNWKATENNRVHLFNIYRSTSSDSGFALAGLAAFPASCWTDTTIAAGVMYYYRVTSADAAGNESTFSNTVTGAAGPKNRSLLVVKDTRGGFNNPADTLVTASYRRMFRDLEHDFSDASVSDSLDISVLGKYQRIIWLSNSFSDQPNSSFRRHRQEVFSWVRDGGMLFVAGFQPTFLLEGNLQFNKTFSPGDTICQYYKISRVERKPQAFLSGAIPAKQGYPQLTVDSSKCAATLPGHLMNLESITPASDATLIYTWQTGYSSSTIQGSMKDKPIGIEYLGNDYKLIQISVPLFYLDSLQAKSLVELVVNEKFRSTAGVQDSKAKAAGITGIFPNPSRCRATIIYRLAEQSMVSSAIFDLHGNQVYHRAERFEKAGNHEITLEFGTLPPGIYLVRIRAGHATLTGKLIIG